MTYTYSLSNELARYSYVRTEDNLLREFSEPGVAFIRDLREILSKVDWENFDPQDEAVRIAFPVLVAAANTTEDGYEVLRSGLGLNSDLIEAYSKVGSHPDNPEDLRRISFAVRRYAESMIEALDGQFKSVLAVIAPVPSGMN